MIIYQVSYYPKHQLYDVPDPVYFSTLEKADLFIKQFKTNDYTNISKPILIKIK